ncbi:MAG: hypothetical protein J5I41_06630 [Saprospiraceae bacterium]|nr:hypothetical protein [Saprospiraceae bacterium]
MRTGFGFLFVFLLVLTSCKKEEVLIPDNQPPYYEGVPVVKIENFVNRLYIDLLAREPLDEEMRQAVLDLQAAKLSAEARLDLIIRLQTNTDFIEGDTSYQRAYVQNLYNLAKIRCLEGVSDGELNSEAGIYNFGAIVDSIEGNWEGYTRKIRERDKLLGVVQGRAELEQGVITFNQLFARVINNAIYDKINMNTVNFVNASFDNLLWRYPTHSELQTGFQMIELNQPGVLFGKQGSHKDDYVDILCTSREMYEGLIIWAYRQLLNRSPSSAETAALLSDFVNHRDIRLIQQHILVTDEYANF